MRRWRSATKRRRRQTQAHAPSRGVARSAIDPRRTLLCKAHAGPSASIKISCAKPAGACPNDDAASARGRQGTSGRGQRGQRSGQQRLARLSLPPRLRGGDARRREPQGSAAQQPGQAPHHQCRHPSRRLLPIRAGDALARLSVAARSARHPGAQISQVHRRHRPLRDGDGKPAPGPRTGAFLRVLADAGRARAQSASRSS